MVLIQVLLPTTLPGGSPSQRHGTLPALKKNTDGSSAVGFGPNAPAGHEGNRVQTMPGKGWSTILRLYASLQPWFDQSWTPGDCERVG